MTDLTLNQFKDDIDTPISSALAVGDIYRISTGKGNVVLMEEAEYNIMREATRLWLALATYR